jgi:hypothetical protein
MSQSLMAFVGIWSVLVLLLTGCSRISSAALGSVQEDIFQAKGVAVVPNAPIVLPIVNGVNGNITVIAARNDEIAADTVATGTGATPEAVRRELQDHVALASSSAQVQIQAITEANGRGPDDGDRVFLHVRVPPGAILPDVHTREGNIGIYGAVGKVTAVAANKGDIEVLGGNGDVDLSTANGSIQVDLMPGKNITVRANNGTVDIIAVAAQVAAASTTQKDVRFIGTLHGGFTHVFSTTGSGNVTIAVPAYHEGEPAQVVYRVMARTSTRPIVVDFPPDRKSDGKPLAICGVIHSAGPYDYHIESTTVRWGRIEVRPSVTTTFYFTGVLTTSYYRFDTDRPQLALFTPRSQSIHIYTAADLAEIHANKATPDADCAEALGLDLNQPVPAAITIDLKSDSGRIFLHHIDFVK